MSVIYQPTDLAGSLRRTFLDEAKAGRARLRDSDGTGIVAMRQADLDALETVTSWSSNYRRLSYLLARNQADNITELGELAWMYSLDTEDKKSFLCELDEALNLAIATLDAQPITELVNAWKASARVLSDELSREVLLGRNGDEDFIDVGTESP